MKSVAFLSFLLLAMAASASTFTGSVTEPKGFVVAPIAQQINTLVATAEAAYRQSPEAVDKDSTLAKEDIERAIAKVIGQRATLLQSIDKLETRDGKTFAVGRINVRSKLVWDADSQRLVETRQRELDTIASAKLKAPITQNDLDRRDQRINYARQLFNQARRVANDRASARVPDAVVEIELDRISSEQAKVSTKLSLMAWIQSVTISPVVKSNIAYAEVKLTLVQYRPANAASPVQATTSPAPSPATLPTSVGADSAPATRPAE